jgi:cell division protein ZipA
MAIPTERGEEQEEQALEPTVATKADVNDASQPDTETGAVDEPVVSDPVIVLCVTAPDDKAFGGSDIRSAAESVGMRFGAMGVFHHFGVGNMQSGESLFCLANMFEPGNFDMENLAACKTHGLVLLMRLPLQIDGAVAFELLLNTAQRLARRLGGHVLNDRRQPLTPEDVARMRSVAASASAA